MKNGDLFKDKEGWWVCCPPYVTEGTEYDAIGPYPTKVEAKQAWTSLVRSTRKWDKQYGRDEDERTGSSQPVRTHGEQNLPSEGLGSEHPREAERNSGKRRRSRRGAPEGHADVRGVQHERGAVGVEAHRECGDRPEPGLDEPGCDVLPGADHSLTARVSQLIFGSV